MIEERRDEEKVVNYEDDNDLAYPVCPVIERVAEEIAEKYFKAFQFTERQAGGKILLSLDKMCSHHNYSLAVCILQTTLEIQQEKSVKFSFEILDACEDANPGAYGMFFEIFFTDENLGHLMWQAKLVESLENIN